MMRPLISSDGSGTTETVVPARKDETGSKGGGKVEGAAIGVAIGATRKPQLPASSPCWRFQVSAAIVGAGWLAAVLGSMAIGGVTGGLLGALTNAGISEEDAQVYVEGVRRGGTLVAATGGAGRIAADRADDGPVPL